MPLPKETFLSERQKKQKGQPNLIDELIMKGTPVPEDAEAVAEAAGGHH